MNRLGQARDELHAIDQRVASIDRPPLTFALTAPPTSLPLVAAAAPTAPLAVHDELGDRNLECRGDQVQPVQIGIDLAGHGREELGAIDAGSVGDDGQRDALCLGQPTEVLGEEHVAGAGGHGGQDTASPLWRETRRLPRGARGQRSSVSSCRR